MFQSLNHCSSSNGISKSLNEKSNSDDGTPELTESSSNSDNEDLSNSDCDKNKEKWDSLLSELESLKKEESELKCHTTEKVPNVVPVNPSIVRQTPSKTVDKCEPTPKTELIQGNYCSYVKQVTPKAPAKIFVPDKSESSGKHSIADNLQNGALAMINGAKAVAKTYFKQALSIATADTSENEKLSNLDMIILKYSYATVCCQASTFEDLRIAISMFHEVINNNFGIKFPAAIYGLCVSFQKLKRFHEALKYLKELDVLLKNCDNLVPYNWLETELVIKETNPEHLKGLVQEMIHYCTYPPTPDAVCCYEFCILQTAIYCTDPTFKGYVTVLCGEHCKLHYHLIPCWKSLKDSLGRSDKEFLDAACLTPDCSGLIFRVKTYGKDGNLEKIFESEDLKSKKMAKQKKSKLEKKSEIREQKKRKRHQSVSLAENHDTIQEEDLENDDSMSKPEHCVDQKPSEKYNVVINEKPKKSEHVIDQKQPEKNNFSANEKAKTTTIRAVCNERNTELNAVPGPNSCEVAEVNPSPLYALKRDSNNEVSDLKPAKKERKKPKKPTVSIDEFCKNVPPSNIHQYNDYQLRLYRLQLTKTIAEGGDLGESQMNPSFQPQPQIHLQLTDSNGHQKDMNSTKISFGNSLIKERIFRKIEELIKVSGFISLSDYQTLTMQLDFLSPEENQVINDNGGFVQFIQQSPLFAVVNKKLCLFSNMMDYYKSDCMDELYDFERQTNNGSDDDDEEEEVDYYFDNQFNEEDDDVVSSKLSNSSVSLNPNAVAYSPPKRGDEMLSSDHSSNSFLNQKDADDDVPSPVSMYSCSEGHFSSETKSEFELFHDCTSNKDQLSPEENCCAPNFPNAGINRFHPFAGLEHKLSTSPLDVQNSGQVVVSQSISEVSLPEVITLKHDTSVNKNSQGVMTANCVDYNKELDNLLQSVNRFVINCAKTGDEKHSPPGLMYSFQNGISFDLNKLQQRFEQILAFQEIEKLEHKAKLVTYEREVKQWRQKHDEVAEVQRGSQKEIVRLKVKNNSYKSQVEELEKKLQRFEVEIMKYRDESEKCQTFLSQQKKEISLEKDCRKKAELQLLNSKKSEYLQRIRFAIISASEKLQEIQAALPRLKYCMHPEVFSNLEIYVHDVENHIVELKDIDADIEEKFKKQVLDVQCGKNLEDLEVIEFPAILSIPSVERVLQEKIQLLAMMSCNHQGSNSSRPDTPVSASSEKVASLSQPELIPTTSGTLMKPMSMCAPKSNPLQRHDEKEFTMKDAHLDLSVLTSDKRITMKPNVPISSSNPVQVPQTPNVFPVNERKTLIAPPGLSSKFSALHLSNSQSSSSVNPAPDMAMTKARVPSFSNSDNNVSRQLSCEPSINLARKSEANQTDKEDTDSVHSFHSLPSSSIWSYNPASGIDEQLKNFHIGPILPPPSQASSVHSFSLEPSAPVNVLSTNDTSGDASKTVPSIPAPQVPKKRGAFDKVLEGLHEQFTDKSESDLLSYLDQYRNQSRLAGQSVNSVIAGVAQIIQQASKAVNMSVPKHKLVNKPLVIQPSKLVAEKPKPECPWFQKSDGQPTEQSREVSTSGANEANTCAICCEDMTQLTAYEVQCGHFFHLKCIKVWQSRMKNCPICRGYVLLKEDYPPLQ